MTSNGNHNTSRRARMRRIGELAAPLLACMALVACGASGNDGAAGAPGATGSAGVTGATGGQGATGADGQQGPQGPQGDAGAPGETGATGPQGPQGETGPQGATGPAGEAPSSVGSIVGTVTSDGTHGIAGVTVTTSPGGNTTQTDANGGFALSSLQMGSYTLTFTAPGYVSQSTIVSVAATQETDVALQLAIDPAANKAPVVSMTSVYDAGFGAPVSITANASDPDLGSGTLTYSWTQTGGPTVSFTGQGTTTIGFTTGTLKSLKRLESVNGGPQYVPRFGVLGINPDETGNYTFKLTATDPQGKSTTASVTVRTTWQTNSQRSVPPGIPQYLEGDANLGDGGASLGWSWSLTTRPATSQATFVDATTQYPHFTPDLPGLYTVKENVSGKSMNIYVNNWRGIMTDFDSACQGCHGNLSGASDYFASWQGTQHYKGVVDKWEGKVGGFGQSCLECHGVGYSPAATNHGFDDVQQDAGYVFKPGPGAWNAMLTNYPAVGQLAGIQCESCHGPQPVGHPGNIADGGATDQLKARVSWSEQVCASCHQEETHHYFPSQWQKSMHSDMELPVDEATVESRGTTAAHCGRCHAAQGYAVWSKQLQTGNSGNIVDPNAPDAAADAGWLSNIGLNKAEVQGQTCQACHDPHDATNPHQLRVYDTIKALPNGQTNITGAGMGALCMSCHNTRNGEHTDFGPAPASFSGPHTPAQTDVLYGFNAYFMPRYNPSPHLAVAEVCVNCHVEIPTAGEAAAGRSSNHSFNADNTICATCHGSSSGTAGHVDGDALQAAIGNSLTDLQNLLATKALKTVATAANANAGTWYVKAHDEATDTYSAATPIPAAPTGVSAIPAIHGTTSFQFTLASPVSFTFGTTTKSLSVVQVQIGSVYAGAIPDAGATPPAVFTANSIINKAAWNWALLANDGTKGIHNPDFYKAVIANTTTQLNTL